MKNLNKKTTQKIETLLNNYNKGELYPAGVETFVDNVERYVKAIKQGRMICSIDSVSKSGMSRTMKFVEVSGKGNNYNVLNFFQLFEILGYKKTGRYSDYFRISGCGMDMVFHTNYTNIHDFYNLGLISKKARDELSQKTPNVI